METDNEKQYRLENLSCANCAAKFEQNVKDIPSVTDAKLNFAASKITVSGDVTVEQLESAGAFDGIRVSAEQNKMVHQTIPFYKQLDNILAAIALVFILAALVIEKTTAQNTVGTVLLFVAIIVGGINIFKVGLVNLIHFEFDMKTLMTIAIIGAAIIGEWKEAAIVVFLFAVSEALESYSMNKARNAIKDLMDIAPPTAIVLKSHGEHTHEVETPTENIEVGDILLVKPGQKIAMDGIVLKGTSTVNEASITGESIPVTKLVDSVVFAGTLNDAGALEIQVTKRVEDSTLSKIIHLVEEAQNEKAPSQKFVDRFAKYYTPIIILIALLVAVIPSIITGDIEYWVYQGLAVLVVGCPCALVISTPVAIVTAIGNAAKQGVLIKGGTYLEELAHIQTIAFDKTGTLTKGHPEVQQIFLLSNLSEQELLALVSSVEKNSQHPLARAVLDEAFNQKVSVPTSEHFQSVTGKGAYSTIENQKVYVGSPTWISEFHEISEKVKEEIVSQTSNGYSVIMAANDEEILGIIAIADPIRDESIEIVQQLYQLGIKETIMLTGDAKRTADAIAGKIAITNVYAGLLPEEKLSYVKQFKNNAPIAMIGDGVNDAPALASANIGIAMGGAGTDVALETADIALMSDDLSKIPKIIKLSKKTLAIIKQNIMFALGLKLIALLLVIPGWLTLWIAIFADIGATLIVVLNSLRLMKK